VGFSRLSWAKNEKYKNNKKGKEIHNSRAPWLREILGNKGE
jgi:hypothetical protein